MTRIVAPTALVIVFVAVFALGIMPKAQAGERKSLRGRAKIKSNWRHADRGEVSAGDGDISAK